MIEHRKEGDIHIITLNAEHNVINPDWNAAMLDALATVKADCAGNSALVLTGTGKTFCAGLDVPVIMQLDQAGMEQFARDLMAVETTLLALPIPVIAALNGHTFAGGAFLALSCDYRIMREDRGWFCLSEVDVGVPIGEQNTALLLAKVPPATARDAALTGKRYSADEAIAAGFADAKSANEALLDAALTMASELGAKERGIFGTIKQQLNAKTIDALQIR